MLKEFKRGIYGFIHIGVLGRWKEILLSQIKLLNDSKLTDKTNKIFVGISGNHALVDCLPDEFKICSIDPILENGEISTLKCLYDMSFKLNNSKIWYIHTKAARYNTELGQLCADSWRNYMQHFVINKHEDCINALDNHDLAGVEWRKNFFAGNFWWANSNYISKIKNPLNRNDVDLLSPLNNINLDWFDFINKKIARKRFLAEFNFIGKENPIVKNFYSFGNIDFTNRYLRQIGDEFFLE